MASTNNDMTAPYPDAYLNTQEKAKDFHRFGDFPAEIQLMILEQAAITAAEELPDKHCFEFNIYKDVEENGSNSTLALFTPDPQLPRVCQSVRSLMQACRAALQAVINVTGGPLRVEYMQTCEGFWQLRHECIDFDFERGTFCVKVTPLERLIDLTDKGGERALVLQPGTRGLEFAPQVKNLMLLVDPFCERDRVLRADLSRFIERFPNITKCTLVSSSDWGGDFHTHTPRCLEDVERLHFSDEFNFLEHRSMYDLTANAKDEAASQSGQLVGKLAGDVHDEPEQTIQGPALDNVGVLEHVMDVLKAKKCGWDSEVVWLSVNIRLQRKAKKDSSSKRDSASCDYLFTYLGTPW